MADSIMKGIESSRQGDKRVMTGLKMTGAWYQGNSANHVAMRWKRDRSKGGEVLELLINAGSRYSLLAGNFFEMRHEMHRQHTALTPYAGR